MKTNCSKCSSSDGVEVYEDHEFCFVCNTYNPNKERTEMNVEPNTNRDYSGMASIPNYRSYPISSRGISLEVVEHFEVKMAVDPEGKPASHFYPYTRDDRQ